MNATEAPGIPTGGRIAPCSLRQGHAASGGGPGGPVLPSAARGALQGSVSFRGKWCKCQTDAYQKLYQAAEIRSRSAATRSTWMTRRRASETLWLM